MHTRTLQNLQAQKGFTMLETIIALALGALAYFGVSELGTKNLAQTQAQAMGLQLAQYNNALTEYIVREGQDAPGLAPGSTYVNDTSWLKHASCPGGSGSNPVRGYLPCEFEMVLPFGITIETLITHPAGSNDIVEATTTMSVPTVDGQGRIDLAAQTINSAGRESATVPGSTQYYELENNGSIVASSTGVMVPPERFLRVDGSNSMQVDWDMNNQNIHNIADLEVDEFIIASVFRDADNNAFLVDPNAASTVNQAHVRNDFEVDGVPRLGGTFDLDTTQFMADVDFNGSGTIHHTNFKNNVDFSQVHTTYEQLNIESKAKLSAIRTHGNFCNFSTDGAMARTADGEILECVGGKWQRLANIGKTELSYFSGVGACSNGSWSNIPDRHHFCAAQSIDSGRGGGALVQYTSTPPDSSGKRYWRHKSYRGSSGCERSVVCFNIGR